MKTHLKIVCWLLFRKFSLFFTDFHCFFTLIAFSIVYLENNNNFKWKVILKLTTATNNKNIKKKSFHGVIH